MTVQDIFVCILAFMPTGWGMLQIAQALKPLVRRAGFWGSVKTLARGDEIVMGLLLFTPLAFFWLTHMILNAAILEVIRLGLRFELGVFIVRG
ncbi:Callose synthase [Vigna angularis]|uniref:Callose synthase n=1 Tax=Phaseolus angularis TaxID=3914 RepID=A0A8T0LFY6_PHAAN|nr:Callose synthase [Vigna angularis]